MPGPPAMLSSKTPQSQRLLQPQGLPPPISNSPNLRSSPERPQRPDRDASTGLPPPANGTGRSAPISAASFAPRGSSLTHQVVAGSFSSDIRSQMISSRSASRPDLFAGTMDRVVEDDNVIAEQNLSALHKSLNREMKIKEGSENMLEALNSKKAKPSKEQRQLVEAELNSANLKIKELQRKISEAHKTRAAPVTPTKHRIKDGVITSQILGSPPSVPSHDSDVDDATESSTFLLAEQLQALKVEGMMPEYYVSKANTLVDLFKRHPTLKYDLAWPNFGLRIQMLLLSESREVVAAAYRLTRYAISDLSSIRRIRNLNTDYRVVM